MPQRGLHLADLVLHARADVEGERDAQGPPLAAEVGDLLLLPVLADDRKSAPRRPMTGWPRLSRTETGTRTVRVLALKVGPCTRVAGRGSRGVAAGRGAPVAAGRRRRRAAADAGATRRRATTSVSVAPASRSCASCAESSGSPKPRSRSSARMMRSLIPARRKRTRSAVDRGSSPRAPTARTIRTSTATDARRMPGLFAAPPDGPDVARAPERPLWRQSRGSRGGQAHGLPDAACATGRRATKSMDSIDIRRSAPRGLRRTDAGDAAPRHGQTSRIRAVSSRSPSSAGCAGWGPPKRSARRGRCPPRPRPAASA